MTAVLLVAIGMVGSGEAPDTPGTYSGLPPAKALKTFRLEPGFRIELAAAEPDVADPVSVAWDARGRMWVAEMSDYPLGPPGGRVRRLEDTDRDGRLERSAVFAEGLPFPTSVLPHRRGVLLSAAPDILYLEDADGDGRADRREVLLTGFAAGNTQLRVNGLLQGIDGRIYGANGRSGGKVRRPGDPPQSGVSIEGRDFRFDPETLAVEAIGGPSQFGHAFDAWGTRFLSWNTVHIREEILLPRDLERHPHLAATSTAAAISDHGDAARVYPLAPPPRTFNNEPLDHFNAGCGLTIECGGIFPPGHAGNAFVCEPLTGLVHRDVLEPGAGPAHIARRGAAPGETPGKEAEFLASTDPWFHPVNLRSGPDGALYVVDFYREMVEHPEYVRQELRAGVDFGRGRGQGRLWRIVPEGARLLPVEDLESLTAADLAARLESPNGPVRETAVRLLCERGGPEGLSLLKRLASAPANGPARACALWSLRRLGALGPALLTQALAAPEARLRETAIRVMREAASGPGALGDQILLAAADGDPRVRLQAALAMGDLQGRRLARGVVFALVRVLEERGVADPWLRLAVLSSLQGREAAFLEDYGRLQLVEEDRSAAQDFRREAARLLGAAGDSAGARRGLELARSLVEKDPMTAFSLASGLAAGLTAAGVPPRRLVEGTSSDAARAHWAAVFAAAVRAIEGLPVGERLGRELTTWDRVAAAMLLAHAPVELALPPLAALLAAGNEIELQLAAARAAAALDGPEVAPLLLRAWPRSTPRVRDALLAGLLRKPERLTALTAAISAGAVLWRDLDVARREELRRALGAEESARLEAALRGQDGAGVERDRAAVVARYVAEAPPRGDPARGAKAFDESCASCHRLHGRGAAVGPDIAGAAKKPRAQLIAEILDPGRSVVPGYTGYTVFLASGEVVTGIVAAEGANSVSLLRAGGVMEDIPRSSIEVFAATGASLMPEGLEAKLTPAEVADLIEFLRAGAADGDP